MPARNSPNTDAAVETNGQLSTATGPAEPPLRIATGQLFLVFSSLALSGFGGVLPFAYRALVERHRWLSAKDFAGLLALAQVMPGPTICNLTVMVGQRHAGFRGACAALAGIVSGPFCIVIALGVAWQRYGAVASVRQALTGMSAVAIGLILVTAVKMGLALFKRDAGAREALARDNATRAETDAQNSYWTARRLTQFLLCALAFAGVGLMRWPLAAVVASLAPFAIALSWFADRGAHPD